MRVSFTFAATVALSLLTMMVGCELATNFDRGRIRDEVAPDASSTADGAVVGDSGPGVTSDASPPVVVAGHVFTTQVAYIKPSNTTPGVAMHFGGIPYLAKETGRARRASVALSADGSTLAVGAIGESGDSRGVDGDETQDHDAGGQYSGAGAVYLFVRGAGDVWSQEAYLKASDNAYNREFGCSVQLSADGNVLAVGARGSPTFPAAITYVFERRKGAWLEHAIIRGTADFALSADGTTLAVGPSIYTRVGEWSFQTSLPIAPGAVTFAMALSARGEALAQIQYPGGVNSGHQDVQMMLRGAGAWASNGSIMPPSAAMGRSTSTVAAIAISADGQLVATGQSDPIACTDLCGTHQTVIGAARLYALSAGVWSEQQTFSDPDPLASSNTSDAFGWGLSLSANARTLAVSALLDDRCANGVGAAAELADAGFCENGGAAWVFAHAVDNAWSRTYVKASNTRPGSFFGTSVALSGDGTLLAVGAPLESSAAKGINGDQDDTSAPGTGAVYLFR